MRYHLRFVQHDGNEHNPCETDSLYWAQRLAALLSRAAPSAYVGIWDDKRDCDVSPGAREATP